MYPHYLTRQVSLINQRSVLDTTPPKPMQQVDLDLPDNDDDKAVAIVHRFVELRRQAPRVPMSVLARMARLAHDSDGCTQGIDQ